MKVYRKVCRCRGGLDRYKLRRIKKGEQNNEKGIDKYSSNYDYSCYAVWL